MFTVSRPIVIYWEIEEIFTIKSSLDPDFFKAKPDKLKDPEQYWAYLRNNLRSPDETLTAILQLAESSNVRQFIYTEIPEEQAEYVQDVLTVLFEKAKTILQDGNDPGHNFENVFEAIFYNKDSSLRHFCDEIGASSRSKHILVDNCPFNLRAWRNYPNRRGVQVAAMGVEHLMTQHLVFGCTLQTPAVLRIKFELSESVAAVWPKKAPGASR